MRMWNAEERLFRLNKQVIISGCNGYLGGRIIKCILEKTDYSIIAVASDIGKINRMIAREGIDGSRIIPVSSEDLFAGVYSLSNAIGSIHLAFSRRTRPDNDIANSIDYSWCFFKTLRGACIQNNVLISSQGVYGETEDFRTEKTAVAPSSPYTMAKYATEILFEEILEKSRRAIIRLESVIQSQNLVVSLCRQVKYEGVLRLRGGKQRFSYVDSDDVGTACVALLQYSGEWKPIYNVGSSNERYTLVEIAEKVANIAVKNGFPKPDIKLVEEEIKLNMGMNCELFMQDTGWHPQYGIDEMIERIFLSV